MEQYQNAFKRYEKKYLLESRVYDAFIGDIGDRLIPDKFPESVICSLYFDTESGLLIRSSLERPVYKEKLRLRSYGVPSTDSNVFLELKQKYKGVVFKRRILLSYKDARSYLESGIKPDTGGQILSEIDGFISRYGCLVPAMLICCKRKSFVSSDDPELRITFDDSIIWRDYSLDPCDGIFGNDLLTDNKRLMEIKTKSSIPVWLSAALSKNKIFSSGFSKYGNAYEIKHTDGGIYCA